MAAKFCLLSGRPFTLHIIDNTIVFMILCSGPDFHRNFIRPTHLISKLFHENSLENDFITVSDRGTDIYQLLLVL